jgi:Ser/Thr protein kinase RdoA (MazF antagonist)
MIDFGAMQHETVAGDVARLLGSVETHVENAWEIGMRAYQEERTLSSTERQAVACFHQSSVTLSGLNWLRWILIEGKSFENTQAVTRRLVGIIAALRQNDKAVED